LKVFDEISNDIKFKTQSIHKLKNMVVIVFLFLRFFLLIDRKLVDKIVKIIDYQRSHQNLITETHVPIKHSGRFVMTKFVIREKSYFL
jgi:hypothetical protein